MHAIDYGIRLLRNLLLKMEFKSGRINTTHYYPCRRLNGLMINYQKRGRGGNQERERGSIKLVVVVVVFVLVNDI